MAVERLLKMKALSLTLAAEGSGAVLPGTTTGAVGFRENSPGLSPPPEPLSEPPLGIASHLQAGGAGCPWEEWTPVSLPAMYCELYSFFGDSLAVRFSTDPPLGGAPNSRSLPTTRGQERASEWCPQSWEYTENAPANCQYEYKPKRRWKPSYGTTTTQSGCYCPREVGVKQHPSNYVYRGIDWRKKKVIANLKIQTYFLAIGSFSQVNITQFRFFFSKTELWERTLQFWEKKTELKNCEKKSQNSEIKL